MDMALEGSGAHKRGRSDVCTAAPGEGERRSVILEVLTESVPVTALLVLVAAAAGDGSGGRSKVNCFDSLCVCLGIVYLGRCCSRVPKTVTRVRSVREMKKLL
ncbi:hypothetical protein CR513_15007, partial [Mucuna pruriens]